MSSHQHEILVTDGSLGLTVQQIAETFLGVSPTLDDLFATTLKSLYSSHGDDAIAHCNALITETPKDPEPLIVCAALLQAMGDPQQAITAYRKAIALKPPYVDQVCRQLDALIDAMHEQLSAETPADGDSTPQVTFKSAEQPLTDDDLADDVQARPLSRRKILYMRIIIVVCLLITMWALAANYHRVPSRPHPHRQLYTGPRRQPSASSVPKELPQLAPQPIPTFRKLR